MKISGIDYESVNDGEGVRTVIYVSGCSHNCKGCHNPTTHDINNGIEFTDNLKKKIIHRITMRPFVKGITLSGGDPLHNNNVKEVYELCKELKDIFPDKTLWIYTGYTFETVINKSSASEEDIYRRNLLFLADVVVDGRFEQDKKDLTLAFRGSSNQRIINIQETLKQGKIILWSNK